MLHCCTVILLHYACDIAALLHNTTVIIIVIVLYSILQDILRDALRGALRALGAEVRDAWGVVRCPRI